MYLSPKSSSSSICLLRDWARSHLYSLPGLTICNPSNKLWSFLDRLYTSNTPLYSKTGPARQIPTLQKTTKFQDLGKQRERSLCSLKIKILTNYPTYLTTQQNFNKKCFSNTKSNGCTQRVHNPVTPFAKYSSYIPKSLKLPKNLQTPKNPKFRQATRTIALFAKNQNLNKLSNQLNPQQNSNQNAFQTPKFNGRTQCVQNHQILKFRQATQTIALFAEKTKLQQIIQIT